MTRITLPDIAKTLRKLSDDIAREIDRSDEPHHLAVLVYQIHGQAGRLLYEAIKAGAFPLKRSKENGGWWDAKAGRIPGLPFPGKPVKAPESDIEYAIFWVFAIGSWLVKAFPSRFPPEAAGWDWKHIATDPEGRPIGKDGKPLKWRWCDKRTGEVLPENTTWDDIKANGHPEHYEGSLDGETVDVTDFYSDKDFSFHNRTQLRIHAEACLLLAELIEEVAATESPGTEGSATDTDPKLSPRYSVAYAQYKKYASVLYKNHGYEPSPEEVYKAIVNDHMGNFKYKYETWSRYVRGALKIKGIKRNTPRANRPHGSSIVRCDQI